MSDRPFAYICSPYRGDTETNAERARDYCRQAFEAGYTPIAPHTIFTQFLSDADPKEREAGMAMGMALMPLCRVLLVCGNDITEGMKAEIGHAQSLGIETCTLTNIPPIPSLDSYRDDLPNLDNIDIAVSLIEGMSGCRFQSGMGVYIRPDDDAYLAVNMKQSADFDSELYRITFDAYIRTMGTPMDAAGLLKFQEESVRIQTLLALLESREFVLTPEEMQTFNESISQRQGPLSKKQFWQMIDDAREKAGGWQGMCTPLIESLEKLAEPDIIRFKQIFNEYLDLAYKDKLWAAAAVMHDGCTDDGFIDFRAWLIAQGKEVYLNALAQPDSLAECEVVKAYAREVIESNHTMPSNGYHNAAYFEVLAYAPSDAYKNITGGDIYKRLGDNPLTEQEKADIADEVTYAADIDAKWGGLGTPQHEVNAALERRVPNLVRFFHEDDVSEIVSGAVPLDNRADPPKRPAGKDSVLAEIAEARKAQGKSKAPEEQEPSKPGKKKSDPEL